MVQNGRGMARRTSHRRSGCISAAALHWSISPKGNDSSWSVCPQSLSTCVYSNLNPTVFLRALEYYRGILFLTSNAPGRFDDAITSRVSLVYEFKDLEPHERKKLRVKFQEKIRKDKGQNYILYSDADAALEELDKSEYTYNGREINNGKGTLSYRHPASTRSHFANFKCQSSTLLLLLLLKMRGILM